MLPYKRSDVIYRNIKAPNTKLMHEAYRFTYGGLMRSQFHGVIKSFNI